VLTLRCLQNFQWLCKLPELPVAVWTSRTSSGCANFQNFQWLCELPAAVQTSRTSSGCANFQNFQWLCELPAAVQTSRTSSGCVDFQWLCSAQVKGPVVRACGGTSKGGRLCGWCGYGKVDYKGLTPLESYSPNSRRPRPVMSLSRDFASYRKIMAQSPARGLVPGPTCPRIDPALSFRAISPIRSRSTDGPCSTRPPINTR
jgi:quinol monooxygenase YgiN